MDALDDAYLGVTAVLGSSLDGLHGQRSVSLEETRIASSLGRLVDARQERLGDESHLEDCLVRIEVLMCRKVGIGRQK